MELTDKNFREKVLKSEEPFLVDFWGSWCLACQQMKPTIKKLEKDFNRVKVGHLNIDRNPKTANRFRIEETPTHILFKKGKVLEKKFGAMSGDQLKSTVKEKLK